MGEPFNNKVICDTYQQIEELGILQYSSSTGLYITSDGKVYRSLTEIRELSNKLKHERILKEREILLQSPIQDTYRKKIHVIFDEEERRDGEFYSYKFVGEVELEVNLIDGKEYFASKQTHSSIIQAEINDYYYGYKVVYYYVLFNVEAGEEVFKEVYSTRVFHMDGIGLIQYDGETYANYELENGDSYNEIEKLEELAINARLGTILEVLEDKKYIITYDE